MRSAGAIFGQGKLFVYCAYVQLIPSLWLKYFFVNKVKMYNNNYTIIMQYMQSLTYDHN